MKDNEGGGTPVGGGGGGGGEGSAAERSPAVHAEQRWRALLEEAESEIAELEARVAELEGALAAAEAGAAGLERRRLIERELTRAGAIDLGAAELLLGADTGGAAEVDIAAAVRSLRERRPYLFALASRGAGVDGASMGPAAPADELGEMATSARSTGDRAALLRYLRRRRSV